ncbi:DUF2842 domain-containing protein [Humitalea sp. 24SJ18S-53]|uniref:DUF2842 domain-containing protein n=1 Tax=Humitalea sp. 24SJ18S-53 TaxID=3422307 RepID=UPI003D6720A2
MSRTWIAIIAGLAGFTAYVAIVVALGDHVRGLPWFVEFTYFGVAGFAWTWPVLKLIAWAVRDPRRAPVSQVD